MSNKFSVTKNDKIKDKFSVRFQQSEIASQTFVCSIGEIIQLKISIDEFLDSIKLSDCEWSNNDG